MTKIFRRSAMTASVALAAVSMAAAAQAQNRVVNVYNWSDYIDASILEDFTAETGIRVVYDVYDSNEILETRLFAGSSGYDVVVPTGTFLLRQIEAGIYQPLDTSLLPNLSNMWDVITERAAAFDPGNEHSVNYMWGTTGLGYNSDRVAELLPDAPVDSWSLIFDPANAEVLSQCGIDVLDTADELIPAALVYLGLDPNSTDAGELEQAQELWLQVRPYIRRFHNSEYINALANGDICVALGYSGDIFQARYRAEEAGNGVSIEYRIPKEGATMWFDQMAIPADAPNVAEAHEFINYMMRPEVIAKATNYVVYANGNAASKEFVDEEILEDPGVYPDDATIDNLFTKLPYDARTQRSVQRIFTTIRTGQ